jgi:hypothetical protein
MTKRVLFSLLSLLVLGAISSGCLMPSFDNLQRDDKDAPPENKRVGSLDGGTQADGAASDNTSDAGTSAAPPASSSDSGAADAGPQTFWCDSDNGGCALGSQICCREGYPTASPTCLAGNAGCDHKLRCGDKSDCPGAKFCCLVETGINATEGRCESSCPIDHRLCDPKKLSCSCAKVPPWGLHYCQ